MAQELLVKAKTEFEKTSEAFTSDPKDDQYSENDAYAAYLKAKTRLIDVARRRDAGSEAAYDKADELMEIEEEHGHHVRLLVAGLKHHGLWKGE